MNPVFIIFKKEMKDLLRDRRTIMAMMILPVVLIPIILTLVSRFAFSTDSMATIKDIRVTIYDNDNGADLIKRFQRRKDLKLVDNIAPFKFKRLIREDSLDFALVLSKNFDRQIAAGGTGDLELFHKSSVRDTLLYSRFMSTIRDYRKAIIQERLDSLGSDPSILNPIRTDKTNVKPSENLIGAFAGSIIPIFFILFCFMGAMYPAIDLFTGEKERNTIETLLVLPASRMQILTGKLLVIVTAGVISGLLTFLGIFLFIQFNQDLPIISSIINLESVLLILPMMIPLTTFFAGLLIPTSIYAKSFKEAQSLLQPLIIVIIAPVVAAMIPSMELNFKTAWLPIFNVALASKAIVADSFNYSHLIIVYISLFLIAAFGILLARQWFGNERNIFRS